MKLYFTPGACSMAVNIALHEIGHKFEMVKVDLRQHQTENGEDYYRINPKGYVPALGLDNGEVLTEDAVLLQYVADLKPESGLAPKAGTMERYRLMEWLNFISSEIHKTLGALFNPNITPEWKEDRIALFGRRCDYLVKVINSPSPMPTCSPSSAGRITSSSTWANGRS
jgi:glutathione S-transferase